MPFNFFPTLRSLSITFFLWAIYYTFELVLGCGAWCFFLWGRAFMVAFLRAFAFFTPMASLSRSLHLPRSPLLPLPPRLLHTHLPPPPLLLTPSCSSPLPSPPAPPPPGPSASSLLEKLRSRQLRDRRSNPNGRKAQPSKPRRDAEDLSASHPAAASSFGELGLSDELMAAVQDLSLSKPTEVQCLGIPAVLGGEDVAIASHTGSGKTLAYMLPLVQCLRRDEMELEKSTRPRRPRAVVLCPTRELAEQVFRVSKSICHHARFRTAMIGGGCRMRPQEDSLNTALDMVVGTPGRLLMHIAEGNMAYGDIKYVVLDEADTMFDRGFGPEVRKFLGPLRNRSSKPGDEGFQIVLVTATITKAVQRLLDEEFPGIRHIRTSTLHKKIPTARHDFMKLSGVENKLEALLQVLEPSLAKRERIMVFCNTVSSCRAVDHFLKENTIRTVNYHGEVPAEERMEGLDTFRNVDGNCPALVCTDLAARGLDLVVDHVIMFDFPLNPIDYLHRTGRTARMGAKGKVTSLVTKRNLTLAGQIEDAIQKGETLEALTSSREKLEAIRKQAVKLNQREKMKTVKLNPREKMKTGNLATRQANRPVKGFKVGKPSPKKTPVFRLSKGATNVNAVSKSMGKGKSRKFVKSPVRV